VLADKLDAHLAGTGTLTRRLVVVKLLHHLGEAEVEEALTRHKGVVLRRRERH